MPLAFPNSPSDGQTHSEGGRTWQYDSSIPAWLVVGEADGILTTDDILDEDTMSSNSATKAPSQQSVVTYVSNVAAPVQSVNSKIGDVVIGPDDLDDTLSVNKFATDALLNNAAALSTWVVDNFAGAANADAARNAVRAAPLWPIVPVNTDATSTLNGFVVGIPVVYANASQVMVTLPTNASTALDVGFNHLIVAGGAGGVTLNTTGVTLLGVAPNVTISEGEAMLVLKTGTDEWLVLGGTS